MQRTKLDATIATTAGARPIALFILALGVAIGATLPSPPVGATDRVSEIRDGRPLDQTEAAGQRRQVRVIPLPTRDGERVIMR